MSLKDYAIDNFSDIYIRINSGTRDRIQQRRDTNEAGIDGKGTQGKQTSKTVVTETINHEQTAGQQKDNKVICLSVCFVSPNSKPVHLLASTNFLPSISIFC